MRTSLSTPKDKPFFDKCFVEIQLERKFSPFICVLVHLCILVYWYIRVNDYTVTPYVSYLFSYASSPLTKPCLFWEEFGDSTTNFVFQLFSYKVGKIKNKPTSGLLANLDICVTVENHERIKWVCSFDSVHRTTTWEIRRAN